MNKPQLIGENDPSPARAIQGRSAVLFSSPHNGHAVPACMTPCMGTDPQWFSCAHEAADLHIDRLLPMMEQRFADASFISANYSRLVCDLNAKHTLFSLHEMDTFFNVQSCITPPLAKKISVD